MDKSFPHLAHLHLKSGHFKEKCIFLRSQIRFFKQTPEHAERNATSHNPYTHLGRKKITLMLQLIFWLQQNHVHVFWSALKGFYCCFFTYHKHLRQKKLRKITNKTKIQNINLILVNETFRYCFFPLSS